MGEERERDRNHLLLHFFDANLAFGGHANINCHQQLCQAMIDHCCTALSPHYESNLTHITAPIRESNLQTKTVKMGKGVYERTSFYLVNQLPYKYIYAKKKVLHFLF